MTIKKYIRIPLTVFNVVAFCTFLYADGLHERGIDSQEILQQRSLLVSNLVSICKLQGYELMLDRVKAVHLLGDLRATEAANFLIENIDVIVDDRSRKLRPVHETFPCIQALERIGSPCIPTLVRELRRESKEVRSNLLVQTLLRIDGIDVARFRLGAEIQTTAKEESDYLQRAIKALEKFKPFEK